MRPNGDRGLVLANARLGAIAKTTLRIVNGRIAGIGGKPQAGDTVLDLRGDRVLPGLINAHDHLQLNNFPRLQPGAHYANVSGWIEDVQTHLHADPQWRAAHAAPRDHRLLLGGIKNLLSGVTTVAHHDPLYLYLLAEDFPLRVVERYGWSHSLGIDGDDKVAHACRQTPANQPWIVHAAEGVDEMAAAEFARLQALDCVGANTVLVHGVAIDGDRQRQLLDAGGALVWCPSSNLHLFGQTADISLALGRRRVALGSDSRLSGGRDLLTEMHIARETAELSEAAVQAMVTGDAANILRLADRGALLPGMRADILVLPADLPLSRASRADLRLVLIAGRACYGDEDCVSVLGSPADHAQVRVDGKIKSLQRSVVEQFAATGLVEPGLDLSLEETSAWPRAASC